MTDPSSRLTSLRHWLAQIRVLRDAEHPLGAEARRRLPETTGLSAANVEWALSNSLEVEASDAQLSSLIASVPTCTAAHVLLSANLFTAPLRAIALAKACAPRVFVRASRRDPDFTELLHRAAPDAFELVQQLSPSSGEHVWAYGSDETMQSLSKQWPPGVTLHAHGDGYGALALENPLGLSVAAYDAMALDVAAFEQRGCLSPRVVVVRGAPKDAAFAAERLFDGLVRLSRTLPLGRLTETEAMARLRHRELYRFLGRCLEHPSCLVTIDTERSSWTVPPSGRVVHVTYTDDVPRCLAERAPALTSVGTEDALVDSLRRTLPGARVAPFGHMQRPALDGPADRRGSLEGLRL